MVHTHVCECCRDAAASTTANTALSADNIVDTYAGADGTLNVTSASTAALAILACKVKQSCWCYHKIGLPPLFLLLHTLRWHACISISLRPRAFIASASCMQALLSHYCHIKPLKNTYSLLNVDVLICTPGMHSCLAAHAAQMRQTPEQSLC